MSASMAEGIAALLSAHVVITDGLYEPTGWCATCGNLEDGDQENHQAAMLAANGYGNVREARAQALEDAASDINAGSCDENYNPASCETCRAVETLRARAVTERGGE